MVVECPQCQTRLRLTTPPAADSSVRVRCSRCQNVFPVSQPPAEENPPAEAPSPPPPPAAPSPVKQVKAPSPARLRFYRVATTTAVVLLGLILGLHLVGIPPSPRNLRELLAFGLPQMKSGAVLVSHRARILYPGDPRQELAVEGELFNHAPTPLTRATIALEAFGPGGGLLSSTDVTCCEAPLPPWQTGRYALSLAVPQRRLGSYQLRLLPP